MKKCPICSKWCVTTATLHAHLIHRHLHLLTLRYDLDMRVFTDWPSTPATSMPPMHRDAMTGKGAGWILPDGNWQEQLEALTAVRFMEVDNEAGYGE